MKTSTKLIAALVTATSLTLAVPFVANAEPMARGGGCAMHADEDAGGGRHGLGGLKLSEEQRDRVFELRHQQAPKMRALAKELRASREQMRALATSGAFDQGEAARIAEQGARAMAEMAKLRAALQADVYALLDDQQRARMREMPELFERHRGGPEGRYGHGGRHGTGMFGS